MARAQRGRRASVAPIRSGVSLDYVAALLGARQALSLFEALCGEKPAAGPRSSTLVDFPTFWKILAASIARTGDEAHRTTGDKVPRGISELLFATMLQGATLCDALQRLADAARLLRPDQRFRIAHHRSEVHLTVDPNPPLSLAKEINVEITMMVVHCILRVLTGYAVTPLKVRGPARVSGSEGSALFSITRRVRRAGTGATIVYDRADADAPLLQLTLRQAQDAVFDEFLRMAAHEPDATATLVQDVRRCASAGLQHQDDVARRLHMSVATLRRRLSEQGISFREIIDAYRRDAAELLLHSQLSVDEIASELGYSDTRSFRRSCSAWFGKPPSKIRNLRAP